MLAKLSLMGSAYYPGQQAGFLANLDSSEVQVAPDPGFAVELGGFSKLYAPFLTERRTRGLVQRCVAGNPGSGLA